MKQRKRSETPQKQRNTIFHKATIKHITIDIPKENGKKKGKKKHFHKQLVFQIPLLTQIKKLFTTGLALLPFQTNKRI